MLAEEVKGARGAAATAAEGCLGQVGEVVARVAAVLAIAASCWAVHQTTSVPPLQPARGRQQAVPPTPRALPLWVEW